MKLFFIKLFELFDYYYYYNHTLSICGKIRCYYLLLLHIKGKIKLTGITQRKEGRQGKHLTLKIKHRHIV